MLKVWLCISITAAEQMRLVQRARTACEACYQKVTLWRIWMWTSNIGIKNISFFELTTIPFYQINLEFYLTGPLVKWVNWCKDSPMCYSMSINIFAGFFTCPFFLFPYSVSTSVWPMFNKSKYNKCDQWCFVT